MAETRNGIESRDRRARRRTSNHGQALSGRHLGSYGGLNLGDEAILEGILRGSIPLEVTVFSRNPEDPLARHGVERALPVREMSRNEVRREIATLDLFILGGGGILFDAEANIYLREVVLAHEQGVPVLVYAISVGPLERPETRGRSRRRCPGGIRSVMGVVQRLVT